MGQGQVSQWMGRVREEEERYRNSFHLVVKRLDWGFY